MFGRTQAGNWTGYQKIYKGSGRKTTESLGRLLGGTPAIRL